MELLRRRSRVEEVAWGDAVRSPSPVYKAARGGCASDLSVKAGLIGSGVRRTRVLVDSWGRGKGDLLDSLSIAATRESLLRVFMSSVAFLFMLSSLFQRSNAEIRVCLSVSSMPATSLSAFSKGSNFCRRNSSCSFVIQSLTDWRRLTVPSSVICQKASSVR